MSSPRTIFIAALVTEGLLVIVSYIIAGLTGVAPNLHVSQHDLVIGSLTPLPLLLGNHVLWRWAGSRPDSIYSRFSREVIVPLCRQVTLPLAAALALLSGFGEELLFRGVMNIWLAEHAGALIAALITSIAFAYVHFIGQLQRYGGMMPLYTVVGLYLWGVQRVTGSLAAVMVCHGLYNFIAIAVIRRTEKLNRR